VDDCVAESEEVVYNVHTPSRLALESGMARCQLCGGAWDVVFDLWVGLCRLELRLGIVLTGSIGLEMVHNRTHNGR
jgi:hypothetical protein